MAEPDNNYFRREAAEAQHRAGIAKTDSDREIWLKIARDWISLLKPEPEMAALTIEISLPSEKPALNLKNVEEAAA